MFSSWWGTEEETEIVDTSKDGNWFSSKWASQPIDDESMGPYTPEHVGNSRLTPMEVSKAEIDEESDEEAEEAACFVCVNRKCLAALVALIVAVLMGLLIGGFLLEWGKADSDSPRLSNAVSSEPTVLNSTITVGAFYYPWHTNNFHNGQGYLREQLSSNQGPTLGEYDDTDPAVISQHLTWSRQANIRLWVTSWWGEGSQSDQTIKNVILPHPDLYAHKIALFYETTSRIKGSTDQVVPDIQYICTEYFSHPSYLRIDGRPVLFVYVTRKLQREGLLDTVIPLMRQTASDMGYDNIYIVGDHAFGEAPADTGGSYPAFELLDAVTNYDVYGSMGVFGGYAGNEGVTEQYNNMRDWRNLARAQDCAFIPSVAPGFNDLGVRPDAKHAPLARKLTPDAASGSLFSTALEEATTLVEPSTQYLLMVNSFNEWHEDTQIEPAFGTTTTEPEDLTYGFEYEGYGELYLDILREATKDP